MIIKMDTQLESKLNELGYNTSRKLEITLDKVCQILIDCCNSPSDTGTIIFHGYASASNDAVLRTNEISSQLLAIDFRNTGSGFRIYDIKNDTTNPTKSTYVIYRDDFKIVKMDWPTLDKNESCLILAKKRAYLEYLSSKIHLRIDDKTKIYLL